MATSQRPTRADTRGTFAHTTHDRELARALEHIQRETLTVRETIGGSIPAARIDVGKRRDVADLLMQDQPPIGKVESHWYFVDGFADMLFILELHTGAGVTLPVRFSWPRHKDILTAIAAHGVLALTVRPLSQPFSGRLFGGIPTDELAALVQVEQPRLMHEVAA